MCSAKAELDAEVAVIGAGIGGLAAAVRLAAAGIAVALFEAHGQVGGKMRTRPSRAGPIDAGPTVLTMRPVFDALFVEAGSRLEDHLTLIRQPLLARHWWRDGPQLDLRGDRDADAEAIGLAFGTRAAAEFRRFDARMKDLHAAFEQTMIQAPQPRELAAAASAARNPSLWPLLIPGRTLAGVLRGHFADPRLRQLFGRYATYVGGLPHRSPPVLGVIWRTEAAGVWAVRGGMHKLAEALAHLFTSLGGRLFLNAPVNELALSGNALRGLVLKDGRRVACRMAVFNGDPAALHENRLGNPASAAVRPSGVKPRSLSARVWTFAAQAKGDLALTHHNLFFADREDDEFGPLELGRSPHAPTIYVCAQDRGGLDTPSGIERFQFILNATACSEQDAAGPPGEAETCLSRTFDRLARFGLHFDPLPTVADLTLPQTFATLFPSSRGALYGRSPHGMMAPFRRPQARSRLAGLYLAGGGVHPGPGVPMAALSGVHAAEAILKDRISASRSHRTAMRGGTSTRSATTAAARSR